MSHQVVVAVILILNFDNRVNPFSGFASPIIAGTVIQTHVSKAGNQTDCK